MACTTTNKNVSIDLEDLFLTKRDDINQIKKNMKLYKKMIRDIIEWSQKNRGIADYMKKFNKFYEVVTRKYRVYVKKNILVYTYRLMIEQEEIENYPDIWKLIQKRPARNLSGVTIITVLTSPTPDGQSFSCKHNCYYCPNEPGQPRSYLKKEPAVARANRNKFDPILQMSDRINSLLINGHEIDKLEIIIEGGTFTEYPVEYLERFHRDLIYCANTYFDKEKRKPLCIDEEVRINETTRVRIIGICIETRPDALIDQDGSSWLKRFRKWGVTRVQLGVQHTDNTILKKINRGHTVEQAEEAIMYLKDNCFKVDIHLMPDLPFSSPEKDIEMFNKVFTTPSLQPDQAKIYPCEVTPWTVIQKWHREGKYKPYAQTNERGLLDVVKYGMEICPPWIRLPRVIRDIPLTYIEGGNMYPNLRQMLTDELKKEGKYTMDIRARECGRNPQYDVGDAEYMTYKYQTMNGTEFFISLASKDEMCIFGFLRLRIPDNYDVCEFECLKNKGYIRELHVYGNLVPVGYRKTEDTQHKGVGKQLINIATEITSSHNCDGIAVISGIGVTGYYKKLGFQDKGDYLVKEIYDDELELIIISSIVMAGLLAIIVFITFKIIF